MNRVRIRGAGGGTTLFILLFHILAQYALHDRKPPVTASLIGTSVFASIRPGRLDDVLPDVDDVCLNPRIILEDWDIKRLFLSEFFHTDDTQLVYNMLSLLWKGIQLEESKGSFKFMEMFIVLLVTSHGIYTVLAGLLYILSRYQNQLYCHCSSGFGTVLFAAKLTLNWSNPVYTTMYGFDVPTGYIAWIELIVAPLFVPGTSYLGCISGISAGFVYVHYSDRLTVSGIKEFIIRLTSDNVHGEGRSAESDDLLSAVEAEMINLHSD